MSLLTRISASPMIANYRKMVPYVRPYWVRAVMPIGSFDALTAWILKPYMDVVLVETGVRYDKEFFPTEDYNLYLHLIGKTKFANLPDVLFQYRKHKTNTTNRATKQIRAIERRVFAYLSTEHADLWNKAQQSHVRVTKVKVFGVPVLKIKHFQTTTKYYLFGFIPAASVYSKISRKAEL